jgi:hypothetical protein
VRHPFCYTAGHSAKGRGLLRSIFRIAEKLTSILGISEAQRGGARSPDAAGVTDMHQPQPETGPWARGSVPRAGRRVLHVVQPRVARRRDQAPGTSVGPCGPAWAMTTWFPCRRTWTTCSASWCGAARWPPSDETSDIASARGPLGARAGRRQRRWLRRDQIKSCIQSEEDLAFVTASPTAEREESVHDCRRSRRVWRKRMDTSNTARG